MTGCSSTKPRHIYMGEQYVYITKEHKAYRQSILANLKADNTNIMVDQYHSDGMYQYKATLYIYQRKTKGI